MRLLKCFLLFIFAVITQQTSAYDFESDGICYSITSVPDRTVSVAGKNVDEGNIIIPSTVVYADLTFTVTAIGEQAFGDIMSYGSDEKLNKLKSVTFPPTLKTIGRSAFQGCGGLKSVTIPASVELLDSMAFGNCQNIESILIEDSDNELILSWSAFTSAYCQTLYLGRGVINRSWTGKQYQYGDYIFSGMNSVTIGKKAKKYRFTGKTIKNVIFDDEIKEIPDLAFMNCSQLNNISLPQGVKRIGNNAFRGCESIESIVIPDGIEIIGDLAFAYCKALSTCSIPDNTIIGEMLFSNCENLKSVKLPSELASIPSATFQKCTNLETIVIPTNLSSIGNSAFESCYSLQEIQLPENVIIGEAAFYECHNLRKVNIPAGNTVIHKSTFWECWSLENISFPQGIETIEENAFRQAFKDSSSPNIILPEGLVRIDKNAFYESGISSISFPSTLTIIGNAAFNNSYKLKEIHFANSITTINENAFRDCSAIESIVSQIESPIAFNDNVFYNMVYLKSKLSVPEHCKDIYAATDGWKNFIKLETHTGIKTVIKDNSNNKKKRVGSP